jgi:sulfite dehydrogenase (quinone) subunit SoeC
VIGMRLCAVVFGVVAPVAALFVLGAGITAGAAALLFVVQYFGLLAERWSFFAEGQHPQNLYYQRAG